MAYYHNLIVEKSWKMLQTLRHKYHFILIGGWAVWLYTKALKSRDIDFICNYDELEKLKSTYELVKNDRLKKYEIHAGEFDIDIYVPFYSELGIPVEALYRMVKSVEGFAVLAPEPLLILKQKAYRERAGSLKGEKDKIDIIAMLQTTLNIGDYEKLLGEYKIKNFTDDLRKLLEETREIPELGLSQHAFAVLKKKVFEKL